MVTRMNDEKTSYRTDNARFNGFNVRPPAPLRMEDDDGLAERWKLWKQQFNDFRTLANLTTTDKEYQMATLRNALGDQATKFIQCLTFDENEDADDWETIIAKLDEHCLGQVNDTFERYKFNCRVQGADEPIEHFIRALKLMAETCNFCKCMKDNLIKDRLIIGAQNRSLTKRLLKESNLTLRQCINICKSEEAAEKKTEALRTHSCEDINRIHVEKTIQSKKMCSFCGRKHEFKKELCPAWKKVCTRCGKANHFAICCRSSGMTTTNTQRSFSNVSVVHGEEQVNHIRSSEIEVNGKKVRFQMDSGASVNLIPRAYVQNEPLSDTRIVLRMWNGTTVKPMGKFTATLRKPISDPPKRPTVSVEFIGEHILEGTQIRLLCIPDKSHPGKPDPSYRWRWRPRSCDGFHPTRDRFTINQSRELTLQPIKSQDDGEYYCVAYNDLGEEMSQPVNVNVSVPAQIINNPPEIKRMQLGGNLGMGSSELVFECVIRGRPLDTINWTHNGLNLNTDHADSKWSVKETHQCLTLNKMDYIWEKKSVLTLIKHHTDSPKLSTEDEGYYECRVRENWKPHTVRTLRRTHLQLLYPPEQVHHNPIYISPTSLNQDHYKSIRQQTHSIALLNDQDRPPASSKPVHTEDMVTLYCLLRANPPPYRLIWRRSHLHSTTTQGIPLLNCSNAQGQIIIDIDPNVRPSGGEADAQLLHGKEAGDFLEKMYGYTIAYTDSLMLAQLVIPRHKAENSNYFLAQMENNLGCHVCSVAMRNFSNPEKPSSIMVHQTTQTAALLSWKPGYDGGYPQRVIVELRPERLRNTASKANTTRTYFRNVPSPLSGTHKCWLTGLEPDTAYMVAISSENKLGKSDGSKFVQFTTEKLFFPIFREIKFHSRGILAKFEPSNLTRIALCSVAQFRTVSQTSWITFHNDCHAHPPVINDNVLVELTRCTVVDGLARSVRSSEMVSLDSKHEDLEYASGVLQLNQIANHTRMDPSNTSHARVYYRVWTCLLEQNTICSQPYEFGPDKTQRNVINHYVWKITTGCLASFTVIFALVLMTYSLKRHRSSKKVWKRRKRKLDENKERIPEKTIINRPVKNVSKISDADLTHENPPYKHTTSLAICSVQLEPLTRFPTLGNSNQSTSNILLIPSPMLIGSPRIRTNLLLHIPLSTTEDCENIL